MVLLVYLFPENVTIEMVTFFLRIVVRRPVHSVRARAYVGRADAYVGLGNARGAPRHAPAGPPQKDGPPQTT